MSESDVPFKRFLIQGLELSPSSNGSCVFFPSHLVGIYSKLCDLFSEYIFDVIDLAELVLRGVFSGYVLVCINFKDCCPSAALCLGNNFSSLAIFISDIRLIQ